jgi:hypothetical protein
MGRGMGGGVHRASELRMLHTATGRGLLLCDRCVVGRRDARVWHQVTVLCRLPLLRHWIVSLRPCEAASVNLAAPGGPLALPRSSLSIFFLYPDILTAIPRLEAPYTG